MIKISSDAKGEFEQNSIFLMACQKPHLSSEVTGELQVGQKEDQASNANLNMLKAKKQDLIERIQQFEGRTFSPISQTDLETFEVEVHAMMRELGDLTTAICLQEFLDSEECKLQSQKIIQSCTMKRVFKGKRLVNIRFAGGSQIEVETSYWARKNFTDRRGKGIYPGLYILGIYDHCSPLLVSEISMIAVAVGSFEEAAHMLHSRGCRLDVKSIIMITKRFSERSRFGQQAESCIQKIDFGNVAGRKVVVSTDGGRLRIRKIKRGPKTKKNRHRYSTAWREPKLLSIYVVGEDGRIDRSILPLIDGTLKGPDALFKLLYTYLHLLNIGKADLVLFVADGAPWIWKRVKQMQQLFALAGITFNAIELVDFYHAAEHLQDFAKLQSRWSEKERKRWCRAQSKLLKAGKIRQVIKELQRITKWSRNKLIKRELEYFRKNRHRFSYELVQALGLPMGSGTMESSIRRVVNLRLKGSDMYWKEDTAMDMLLLRSYYKAGRWSNLKQLSYLGAMEMEKTA
jgi:hypothetical protein